MTMMKKRKLFFLTPHGRFLKNSPNVRPMAKPNRLTPQILATYCEAACSLSQPTFEWRNLSCAIKVWMSLRQEVLDCCLHIQDQGLWASSRPELPMGQRQGQQILKRLSDHCGSKPKAFGRSPLSAYFTEGGRIIMINVHLLPLI